ncbi:DUF7373 family lipoprotein [Nocardia jejuensis]|uniref:DUF7373 family lipoprotein n=1 Tax=Nocardia jejuensis TaxID=328049 RepID=UPI00082B4156|nr:hypothetical protein [Nocardia jejuensis]
MLSRGFRAAAAVAAALTAAGCAHVGGTAAPGEIDVRTLDVGSYSTQPLDLRYTYYNDLGGGRELAMMRLAGRMATGPDIDPALKYGIGAQPIGDVDAATKVLDAATAPALARNGMLFGYSADHTDREPAESGSLRGSTFAKVLVLQFPGDAAAAQAAAEIDDLDFAVAAEENQHVTLPKYPTAHAHWRPTISHIGSTIAHGSYVVRIVAGVRETNIDQLVDLVGKIYGAQLPLLDSLRPLSREDMLRLPYDSDGMLRRTLNPDGFGSPNSKNLAVFEPRGFLNQVKNQELWTRLANESGLDRFALNSSMSNESMLFRTRDTAAARKLTSEMLGAPYPGAADAPPGIPDALCGESARERDYSTKRFRCVVTYRQYVATVEGDQLSDAQQRAAAQYALLANSTW